MTSALRSTGLLVLAVAMSPAALAQNALPTREEVAPPPPDSQRPPTSVRINADDAFARPPCPLADSAVRVNLNSVAVTGPGGAPLPPDIAVLMQGLGTPGPDQPVSIVCDLRDTANQRLRAARYIASAQIPAQRIEDGVIRLEVVTARIVEMRVRGDAGPYEAVLSERIDLLRKLDPLNEADAERVLLLASDIPGLDVQMSLRPAESAPGDVIGELEVSYRPWSAIVNVQNYNSRLLGRETAYVRGELYGLTGAADLTYLAASTTFDFEEQRIIQAGHVTGLGSSGATLAFNGTYAESRPALATLDLRTKSRILSGELVVPLDRSVDTTTAVALGLENAWQQTRVRAGNISAPLNLDKVTSVYARIYGNQRTRRSDGSDSAFAAASLEVRKGLDIFGATRTGFITPAGYTPSRFEGSATATVVRGTVDATVAIGPVVELAVGLRGQWANRPLLNYDEFAVGNLTVGRGYDPGANSGDRGLGTSYDIRFEAVDDGRNRVQIYSFFDAVKIFNIDRNATEDERVLKSVGGGVRWSTPWRVAVDVTYAHPLSKALSFDKAPPPGRLMFSITAQFGPSGITN